MPLKSVTSLTANTNTIEYHNGERIKKNINVHTETTEWNETMGPIVVIQTHVIMYTTTTMRCIHVIHVNEIQTLHCKIKVNSDIIKDDIITTYSRKRKVTRNRVSTKHKWVQNDLTIYANCNKSIELLGCQVV